jgi:glycosyltransferase involved in cell wall biosynthesis
MTIVQYITPSRIGGAETYFLRLCAYLARRGHRVIVVTKRDTPLRARVDELKPLGVEVQAWRTSGKLDPRTLARLIRLLRRERADVLNTHLTTASWLGAWAGRMARVPTAAWVHGRDSKTWFQFAPRLIAVAVSVRDYLIEQGVSGSKIEILYYGVDLERFSPLSDEERREARAHFALPISVPVVGVVAHLTERKGHRFLFDALVGLPSDVHVLLAGEGALEEELRAHAQRVGIEERVHFLGFQSDVRRVLAALDVFCLPSLKEGLPISIMEAQACGLVVVATRTAGVPEVVREGETGFLCAPGDVASLRSALGKAIEEPDKARQIGQNARHLLEERFPQQHCLEQVEAFLMRLAHARSAEI